MNNAGYNNLQGYLRGYIIISIMDIFATSLLSNGGISTLNSNYLPLFTSHNGGQFCLARLPEIEYTEFLILLSQCRADWIEYRPVLLGAKTVRQLVV